MPGNIWKGSISFGLLNIPVTLHKAEEEKELHFSLLDEKDHDPIKYKKINALSGKEVPWERIIKGYEFEKGKFVVINKDDLKTANPRATQTIEIEDFVEFGDIDFMFMERPYYLVPQKNGIKGYFLLSEALNKTKKAAIAKIVIRTKQHLVAIISRGHFLILETLRFSHEVLEINEVKYFTDIVIPRFTAKELKMAEDLVRGMTTKWNPARYKDNYYSDVMKIIKLKIKNADINMPKIHREKITHEKVIDLMPLLKKSLEDKKHNRKKA